VRQFVRNVYEKAKRIQAPNNEEHVKFTPEQATKTPGGEKR
jgi:hypothetical protein